MSTLVASDLCFSFGDRPVLEDVRFDLAPGEVVGLIGPNGAGKSTLMKMFVRLLEPSTGSLLFDGKPLSGIPPGTLARQMAYLPQSQEIYWPLTAGKVVALGRIPHLAPWESLGPEDEEAIAEAMRATDTLHLAGRPVDQLAGGEQRLVLIARLLASAPSVILADEPVMGLDPCHELQVMELFRDLAVRKGKSVAVVLHNLTLAARFCDRIFLMHRGKILTAGAPDLVLREEYLRESYGIEARYGREKDGFYVIPWKRIGTI
ncbi:MAG: ABC transporter ATP-binding protein [Candidatus Omnitrophota bacterium]|jgi:iron complex transport system ATP-binding protein